MWLATAALMFFSSLAGLGDTCGIRSGYVPVSKECMPMSQPFLVALIDPLAADPLFACSYTVRPSPGCVQRP